MRTWLRLLLLVWSATVFAQDTSAPPPASADANAAITTLREGLVDSFVKADIDRLLTFLDPEVVVTWQNAEVCRGPDAVRTYYQRMMSGPDRVVREVKAAPEIIGRNVYGDWAISWGNLRDHFVLTDGSDLPLNTVFTATIARRGDRWLVRGFHASVNAFENPVMELAIKKTAMRIGLSALVVGLLVGFILSRMLRPKPAVVGPAADFSRRP
jgi:ketosteroid isomerase-like protein